MLRAEHADAVADAFGLGPDPTLIGPVARGEVGQIWRLETSGGDWAIKEAFEPPSPTEADHDAALQELVATSGINVPSVRRTLDGHVLANIAGSLVRAYSWVEVAAADRTIDPEHVGHTVAAIHRVVHRDANPVHPWYTDPVGADRWDNLIGDLRTAQAPFAERLAEQRDELVALEALLTEPAHLQACHRDLFADNVLPTLDGELCVIDWENSGLADPSQELAVVLFEYGRGLSRPTAALYNAYTANGGAGRIRGPSDFTMLIAQLGHIGELACQRWLDPSHASQRGRNETRIDEFLTERLTRTVLNKILDTITRR